MEEDGENFLYLFFHFRSESLNRCISLMGGEVKKYKSDFETGNDASLPILRTKQSTVTYQASLYHKKTLSCP